jgi:predicted RNA-binding protein YlxR (DUF448 family)
MEVKVTTELMYVGKKFIVVSIKMIDELGGRGIYIEAVDPETADKNQRNSIEMDRRKKREAEVTDKIDEILRGGEDIG